MTKNQPELKACPFCPDGGKPYKSDAANESNDTGGRMVYVGCANCGVNLKAANYPQMDGSWKMSKDIVSIWNTRPSPIIPEDAVKSSTSLEPVSDDALRQAVDRIMYGLISISDDAPYAYLERYEITPSVNKQNNIKKVCSDIETLITHALKGQSK